MSTCNEAEALRDYAFDELPAAERPGLERHIAACPDCAAELDRLRVTTAALRMLPDREIPQRIAFVSDKVFQPSRLARLLNPYLGFASACVLAGAIVFSAYHWTSSSVPGAPVMTEAKTIVQTVDVTKQVNDAVEKAVARVQAEDARMLAASDAKHEQEHRNLMEAVTVLQERQNVGTLLASAGEGQ
jgi:anti-sigma factor RsiW